MLEILIDPNFTEASAIGGSEGSQVTEDVMNRILITITLLIIGLVTACSPQRRQVTSPQTIIVTDPIEEPAMGSEVEPEYKTPHDLIELTILDTDSLLQGCTTEVLYEYDRENGVWLFMHPDREQPNRYFGAVLESNIAPTFSVGSRCGDDNHNAHEYDGTSGYKEYHGPIELWRRTVHGSWKQLEPRMQYEGWSTN